MIQLILPFNIFKKKIKCIIEVILDYLVSN